MNTQYFKNLQEYIDKLCTIHHPEAVKRFMDVYSGTVGIGMTRVRVNGEELSAIAQANEDGSVAILFICPGMMMKVESMDGSAVAHRNLIDSSGEKVKSH